MSAFSFLLTPTAFLLLVLVLNKTRCKMRPFCVAFFHVWMDGCGLPTLDPLQRARGGTCFGVSIDSRGRRGTVPTSTVWLERQMANGA